MPCFACTRYTCFARSSPIVPRDSVAGRALVASLLELTEGRPAPSLQLPTQLIVRHTTV